MNFKYILCFLLFVVGISCKDSTTTQADNEEKLTTENTVESKSSKITKNPNSSPNANNMIYQKLGVYNGFEMVVTKNAEKVHVECVSGCHRWTKVNVPLTNGRKQVLNTQGTSLYREAIHKTADEAQFEIYIYQEGSNMIAKCLRGCSWEDVSFRCTLENCNATITNEGVSQS